MANFIKLTPTVRAERGIDQSNYVNIDHIEYLYATNSGSYLSLSGNSAERVKETPAQILALIAEAQGAK